MPPAWLPPIHHDVARNTVKWILHSHGIDAAPELCFAIMLTAYESRRIR